MRRTSKRHNIASAKLGRGLHVIAIVIIFCGGCSDSGSIAGVVVDAVTERPISNTVVRIGGTAIQTTTSAEGKYSIPDIAPGNQTLVFEKRHYLSSQLQIVVGRRQSIPAEVVKLRPTLTVWNVGSPHNDTLPSARIPPEIKALVASGRAEIEVRLWRGKEFSENYTKAVKNGELPEILVIDNYGIIQAMGPDHVVKKSLVMVANSLKSFESEQGGWQMLLYHAPNFEAAKTIITSTEPQCGDSTTSRMLPPLQTEELEKLAKDIVTTYFRNDPKTLQKYAVDSLAVSTNADEVVEAKKITVCSSWGNENLAFLAVKSSFEAPSSLGYHDILLILSKVNAQWRLVTITKDPISVKALGDAIPQLARRLTGKRQGAPLQPAVLLSPEDGKYPSGEMQGRRFGDFIWQPSKSPTVIAEMADFNYREARLFFRLRSNREPIETDRISTGELWTTGTTWHWRIWSIAEDGTMIASEARRFVQR